MPISRRRFLESTAAGAIAAQIATAASIDKKTGMPMRPLGRTGESISILAFGSGSRWLAYPTEEDAFAAMNRALDMGVNYLDTAQGYGNGVSETRVGKLLKARGKKGIFLATKISGTRNGDQAMRQVEESLKRLQLAQVDLLHIHSLTTAEDLAAIEAPDGVLKALYNLRDQKVARFIGITCHTDPRILKTALERHDFDCTQMALNAAQMGQESKINKESVSFETVALPAAVKKNMGVLAMKIFAQDKLVPAAPHDQLIRYTLSLPVAAAVIGMPKREHIEANLAAVKAFRPMMPGEKDDLSGKLAPQYKASIDRYFCDHVDA